MSAAEPHELMTLQEIARLLGVSQSAVSNYQNRTYLAFPEPWGRWSNRVALWRREDIEAWAASRHAAETERLEEEIARHEAAIARLRAQARGEGVSGGESVNRT